MHVLLRNLYRKQSFVWMLPKFSKLSHSFPSLEYCPSCVSVLVTPFVLKTSLVLSFLSIQFK